MTKKIYLETLKSVLGRSISHYYPRVQIKKKYALINQFKDFKESLIIYHLQQLRDNPSLSNTVPPLHEMLAY